MSDKKPNLWLKSATRRMEKKGTAGKFGKATQKKIEAGKKAGGVEKKEAVFAENMKKIAAHHHQMAMHHQALEKLHTSMLK